MNLKSKHFAILYVVLALAGLFGTTYLMQLPLWALYKIWGPKYLLINLFRWQAISSFCTMGSVLLAAAASVAAVAGVGMRATLPVRLTVLTMPVWVPISYVAIYLFLVSVF